jgi:2',3'-cyclic-nucleotide 2'-phosphodiesterase (5'-nucleotidase family)
MFQGSPISNIFLGKPVIEMMNYLRFDAMAIGNHEFDWGRDVLASLAGSASFPFLSANVQDEHSKLLPGVKPYILLERKGLKIAIIGLTTPEVAYTTRPDYVKDLKVIEPVQIVPRLIKEVRAQGAKLVVLLTHLGFDEDRKLAAAVQGIDVIIGGHSHTAVTDPPRIGRTIVAQAGYHGIYLGAMKLTVDTATGEVVDYTGKNELTTVLAGPESRKDETMARMARTYDDQLRTSFAEVLGETTVDLTRNYERESNIGNLVTDAMREATGAEIAFEMSGGIRIDIPLGKISREQVFSMLPFDDEIITMDLTGQQVREVLERSGSLEKGMIQISGMTVLYDLAKPEGGRVVDVAIGGRPIDPGKTYRVAVTDFLAAGGDKFTTFKQGKDPLPGEALRDAVISYLRKHTPLAPRVEGRSRVSP